MIVHFHIHYKVVRNQSVIVHYRYSETAVAQTLYLQSFDHENWLGSLVVEGKTKLYYNYFACEADSSRKEWGSARVLTLEGNYAEVFVEDTWRLANREQNVYLSNAFKRVIFKREYSELLAEPVYQGKNAIRICMLEGGIPQNYKIGISGNIPELGNWLTAVVLSDSNFPNWQTTINLETNHIDLEYKFVLLDEQNQIMLWEKAENRAIKYRFASKTSQLLIVQQDSLFFTEERWRGTGVAIPVFSLRSSNGFGIGEFLDLKPLVDWARQCQLNLVQVLPVNDTLANMNWQDCYPYAAISVFALHPLYVNVAAIGSFKDQKIAKRYEKELVAANKLEAVDFELVLRLKFEFLHLLFDQMKADFYKDSGAQQFIEKNREWLIPYALFCNLRDEYKTCVYDNWGEFSDYSKLDLSTCYHHKHKDFDRISFYIFVQYHAHLQLEAARDYAVSKQVVLKGDLPIGIYRYSCDAWVAPQLYNMDEQAGAPPDDFAVLGQNWGFPTYNWKEMAKDDFSWWQKRMQKLSEYFDALRIDHILGFFRIWQVPTQQIEGTMGLFNPRLPYHISEIKDLGKVYDLERWTIPYIRSHAFEARFGEHTDWVVDQFLELVASDIYVLKPGRTTQLEIKNLFLTNDWADKSVVEVELYHLVSEVLLIEEPNSDGQYYNPRITLHTTQSYQELSDFEKPIIMKLYNDYYFHRHNDFWKEQALWKLPALLSASEMLIFGEDLGMIPDSVPDVMRALNIITLEIQRMPKGGSKFGHTWEYPYMSVCSPSCHDMSTIRGWWEADYGNANSFYYDYLKWYGLAPKECAPNVVEGIVKDHLVSPSMFAIFPIQDLVGMDGRLRRPNAQAEQINEPSNPKHYWRFRFHMPIEDLLQAEELNHKIRLMIRESGRA